MAARGELLRELTDHRLMTASDNMKREKTRGKMPWTAVACLALLLAACDSHDGGKGGAETEAPGRSEAVAGVQAAPAATAVAQDAAQKESPGVVEEVRVPYVARQGEGGLDSLSGELGKYPHDGVDYLRDGVLAERLRGLLAGRYEVLLANLGTVGSLTQEGALWSLIGLRPHRGGEEAAAIVIDPERNGLRVWLLSEGRQTVYTDVDGPEIGWTPDVLKTMGNVEAGSK